MTQQTIRTLIFTAFVLMPTASALAQAPTAPKPIVQSVSDLLPPATPTPMAASGIVLKLDSGLSTTGEDADRPLAQRPGCLWSRWTSPIESKAAA